MTKLPQIRPKQLIKILEKEGFFLVRSAGSHHRYHHSDGRRLTVAIHSEPLKKGTLKSILKQAEISTQDLINLL